MSDPATILVVDDVPANIRLLEAVLSGHGYNVVAASSGREALDQVAASPPDLVLLDLMMPGMDGHEVCRRLRGEPATEYLPILMVTASGDRDKVNALELGVDDFIAKPFDNAELLARVRSLLRIHSYREKIEAQSAELADLNRTLESRVSEQVDEIARISRLKRFLSPQVTEVILSDEVLLESHRREITVVFFDLRGFTAFAETGEPEDVVGVLRDYHTALGSVVFEHNGTLERFTGDGVMVFFNDPLPCNDPALSAVRMSVAMRERFAELRSGWSQLGHELDCGTGIAQGYATLGRIGFEGRSDYAAIGTVTNLAARLCGEAGGGQILISERVQSATNGAVVAERIDDLTLKGISKPVRTYNVVGVEPVEAR
jgi:class 3 adenylate cyclase/CheY-like chemotaxis protein